MRVVHQFISSPDVCTYLPEQTMRMQGLLVATLTAREYQALMNQGWRRFGRLLFRPMCSACRACRPLRVDVQRFKPNRSQRRAWRANADTVRLTIGEPRCDAVRLDLYDRYHRFQAVFKGWPAPHHDAEAAYQAMFVDNPLRTSEYAYYLGEDLIGVGYVDEVPDGLSAIYFFYDPQQRRRCLGTFNVLSLIAEAARRELPYVYLGYYVAGCRSLEYKADFRPNQILEPGMTWKDFRSR